MKIYLNQKLINFEIEEISIIERNIENIFSENKKSLLYKLVKAQKNPKDRLNKIASVHLLKYKDLLHKPLGSFLVKLKEENNDDYKLYLNKYGDNKYCHFKIEKNNDKRGLYCYIVNNDIVYIGRSKKTFKERINEYGKITPYNCLIDGQATNCNINSKINKLDKVFIGFHIMEGATDIEISNLEKELINFLKKTNVLWNVQKN